MPARSCPDHPEEEALLSCSVCERPLCGICARNTQVGTRCARCAGEQPQDEPPPIRAAEPKEAAPALRRPYHLALACAVVIVMLTQGAAIPLALPAAAVFAWSWQLESRRRFLLGTGAFIVVWTIAVSLLLEVSDDGKLTGTMERMGSPVPALGLVAALGVCAVLLFGPSRSAARELLERGRPIAAAFVVCAGGGAALLSATLAVLVAASL